MTATTKRVCGGVFTADPAVPPDPLTGQQTCVCRPAARRDPVHPRGDDVRPWFPKKLARLDDIAALEAGWIDGKSGDKPTPEAVDAGRRLVAVLAMLAEVAPTLQVQIVPTADGGLSLEWHEGGWAAEIGIEPTGTISVWARHRERQVTFSFGEDDE